MMYLTEWKRPTAVKQTNTLTHTLKSTSAFINYAYQPMTTRHGFLFSLTKEEYFNSSKEDTPCE